MTTNISSPWRLPVWDSSGPYLLRRTPGCSVEHKLDLFSLAVRDGSEHFKSTVSALAPQTEQRSLNPLLTRSIQGLSDPKITTFSDPVANSSGSHAHESSSRPRGKR